MRLRNNENDNINQQRTFLTAQWKDLAMINYELDPSVLSYHVPFGTELDFWNGKTFLSVVGFLFLNTRVMGIPIPLHTNFEEVNLRFYVRRKGREGWRRGVVFIREIVPKWAIATIARLSYNEKYISLSMRHSIEEGEERVVQYGWMWKKNWNSIRVKTVGPPKLAEAGSLEEFITEHYWGYSTKKDGGTLEYAVEHPKWQVWNTLVAALDCDVRGLYGSEFVPALRSTPSSAFLAEGSDIRVFKPNEISPTGETSSHLR